MSFEMERTLLHRGTVGDGLRRSALRYPTKAALIFYDADGRSKKLTYAELNSLVNRLANTLLKLGVKKGDRIAVLSHNSIEVVILMHALMKIGAWYCPLNFMLNSSEVQRLVNFSTPKMLFVEENLVPMIENIVSSLDTVKQFVYISLGPGNSQPDGWKEFEEMLGENQDEPEVLIDDDDVASLFFTSGTESAPKGVLTSHRNYYASHLTYFINAGLIQDDIFLLSIPIIHMAGFDLAIMGHMATLTVVMTQLPNPPQMLQIMEQEGVTATALPPTLYVAMVAHEDAAKYNFCAAKRFITWASTIPKAMVDGWNRLAPNMRFFTIQGSSESTATAITGSYFKNWEEVPNGDGRWVGKNVSFGCELKLVDENDREVNIGEQGEQVIRGPVVMQGYYQNDELNERVFRGGWFHTGDILFRDENGNYFFADRKKDMIKTGGENVFSQEIESVIGAHPKVLQCAVFGIPDPRWGEAVTVAVVPMAGANLTEDDIIAFCKEKLPGFKVPKHVFFRKSLPISAANKILKRVLKEEYSS